MNLPAISAALCASAADPAARPAWAEPSDADAARRMVLGYQTVDEMLARGADPFALGGSAFLVELNHVVLCGRDPARRRQFAAHLDATERRFYDDPKAGADGFFAWLALQPRQPVETRAALVWSRIVSEPQLFIEGNQRTATLVASVVLAQSGRPPMVATRVHAARFASAGERCRHVSRGSWSAPLEFALVWRALRRLIRETADPAFLVSTT